MIPLIFAFSILALPAVVASYFVDPASDSFGPQIAEWLTIQFGPTGTLYWITVFILVVIFTFFYTAITVPTNKMSDDLKRSGGFVPGIRPGNETAEYLDSVMSYITFPGSLYLAAIAVFPAIVVQ